VIISGTVAISDIAVITGRAAASEKMAYIWSSDHFRNCSNIRYSSNYWKTSGSYLRQQTFKKR